MAGESLIRQNKLLVEDSKRIHADEERASQSFIAETNCSDLSVAMCVVKIEIQNWNLANRYNWSQEDLEKNKWVVKSFRLSDEKNKIMVVACPRLVQSQLLGSSNLRLLIMIVILSWSRFCWKTRRVILSEGEYFAFWTWILSFPKEYLYSKICPWCFLIG